VACLPGSTGIHVREDQIFLEFTLGKNLEHMLDYAHTWGVRPHSRV